jgi:hypothetical protein
VARAEPPSAASRRRLIVELLDQLLSDKERPPPSELPHTGLSLAAEAALSSICVAQRPAERAAGPPAGYGTVAQTVLLIGRDGHAMIAERRMRDGATLGAPSLFEFDFARPPRGLVARAPPSARWALGLGLAFSLAACLGFALVRPHSGARGR